MLPTSAPFLSLSLSRSLALRPLKRSAGAGHCVRATHPLAQVAGAVVRHPFSSGDRDVSRTFQSAEFARARTGRRLTGALGRMICITRSGQLCNLKLAAALCHRKRSRQRGGQLARTLPAGRRLAARPHCLRPTGLAGGRKCVAAAASARAQLTPESPSPTARRASCK